MQDRAIRLWAAGDVTMARRCAGLECIPELQKQKPSKAAVKHKDDASPCECTSIPRGAFERSLAMRVLACRLAVEIHETGWMACDQVWPGTVMAQRHEDHNGEERNWCSAESLAGQAFKNREESIEHGL